MTVDFKRILGRAQEIPGFFTTEAMIAWDFFLNAQGLMKLPGHFLEIGVYEGKSAVLGAAYLAADEQAVLVDVNPCTAALGRVREVKPKGVVFVEDYSFRAVRLPQIRDLAGQYRFIHIDGDHTGYNAAGDLEFAASAIKEEGLICMDDFFNPVYPQLTAAIYKFLFDHQMTFRMVLCGAGKCFIVKSSFYRYWENLIRKHLVDHSAAYGATFLLHKSSYAHDFGCFSINTTGKSDSGKRMFGPDFDNDDIVF